MPFPSAAEVQGVPATPAAQSSRNGGLDIASLIQNISTPIPQGLMQAATTPVQGGHAMQVPSSLQQPIGPHQDRPMDQRQVVGRKAAKLQGIGNAITGATNAIGAVVTKEAQIKQNQIKDSATKVIQAQQAIDEAKQLHDSALATGDAATASKAQEMIQKNTQARDAIFADPKMRKTLVKGFNISYTDPASNKTEEHTAVMAAMKDAKNWQEKRQKMQELQQQQNQQAGSAAGEAFAKGQPQGMAANALAQSQVSMIQAQQKIQQQTMKDVMTYQAAMAGHQATVTAAQLRTQAQSIQQQNTFNHQQDMLNQRFAQAQHLLKERLNNDFALIGAREKAARELADDVYSDKETDPLTMYTKSNTAMLKYQDNLSKNQNLLTTLMEERQKLFPKGAGAGTAAKDPEGYQALNVQIALTQQQIKQNQQMVQNLQQQSQQIKTATGLKAVGVSDGGAASNSTDGNSLGSEPDFTDPSIYANQDAETSE